ncbi:MAG: hypothetical protein M1816_000775 [Peltula sp. TS41687]|nr:MAG: hypothetical protein M1816_000775 [Peltula sp. TS41687]
MFGLLQAQAPAKQTATDTINTLSSRLLSGKLLEDRRAAILGLRSFAKEYPASVASGSLRGLIGSLKRDGDDVDTVKLVLETLLALFSLNDSSPEASEEVTLWLADEFTQRQDNITILLDLLGTNDFYSRLYSLQLLSAIHSARPERTQECVFTAPLGVSRLVAVLDDRREAIRNEGLILLISLTPSSREVQKLVAFENAFDRILALMNLEGALTHGGVVIQDCLSLLANLLRFNVSNQSFFRETGCVPKLAHIVADAVKDQSSGDGVAEWVKPQRDKNLWGILAVIRLFLIQGGLGTQANQLAFWHSGILTQVLNLAFDNSTGLAVRAEALTTCADLIRGNPRIQEGFAQLEVTPVKAPSSPKEHEDRVLMVNIIHALLELTLEVSANPFFDVRLAGCECLKAYSYQHSLIRLHFVRRAIEGYSAGSDDIPNVLATLLTSQETPRSGDPYRVWFASVILLHLIYDDPDAKSALMGVSEGDASAGEEVVTCIQALTSGLVAGLQRGEDARFSIGYLMLLCCWLFEDPDAVNDFLGEGSSVHSLVQGAARTGPEATIVQGMFTVLLGIVYEFSTKDSPVARATIHPIISSGLGREQYIDKLTRLREHPLLRDFEVLHQGLGGKQAVGLPDVLFDKTFVYFFKDNFSRLLRAVDRDPGLEISVVANGVQKGISRELVDTLRTQVDEKNQALTKAENEILTLERRLGQEQAEHRRAKETATVELNRIRIINQGLQKQHEEELDRMQREYRAQLEKLQDEHGRSLGDLQFRIRQLQLESEDRATKVRERNDAEIADLKATVQNVEEKLAKANRDHILDLQTAHDEHTAKVSTLEARLQRAESRAEEAENRAQQSALTVKDASIATARAKEALEESEKARGSTQAELDDLLIVLGDLEEKRAADKKRLKTLGEVVSDVSDEGDEELSGTEQEEETAADDEEVVQAEKKEES